jgi:peptide/nickel transport system permease protein
MPGSTPASATASAGDIQARPELTKPKRSNLALALGLFRRSKTALAGLLIITSFVIVALAAPWITPYDPVEVDLGQQFTPPGRAHFFGTDNLGRDILSRVIAGARVSLWVGMVSVGLSMLIGVPAGLVAGYLRGLVDSLIMRLVDVFLAFPVIILAIAIMAVRGPGLTNVMIALAVVYWTTYARVTRGVALVLREEDYVLAARSVGVSDLRIMWRHILPNGIPPILVIASLGMGSAILAEAALSFLGLGIQPPQPSWGSMLSFGMQFLRDAPYLSTFPGLAIFITVLGFNLLGDGLRDALDPRLRQS